ncbi:MAG: histidine--tRNA ligase [Candidatus Omnitrophica bacterium]|nr:histidine--tRNA ligase [Candidatus Omnitrophota bacterium]
MEIKALKGVEDILPSQIKSWNYLESSARELFNLFGFQEIRIPIIEESRLFIRSIGEDTDIVEKEMYIFQDKGLRKIALRPEATASVVRAYLEHGFDQMASCKFFYLGPMFRGEKPQAGRNRQFYQIGVEALGSYSPYLDVEVIHLAVNYLHAVGLNDFQLLINSVGSSKDKQDFSIILKKFLTDKINGLCENCKQRFERNILRVLDCKNSSCKKIISEAPKVTDYLSKESADEFDLIKQSLNNLNINYLVVPNLVRGLDYYTKTVFEIIHSGLGAQDTILAGGRYDNLIADLGGKPNGAVGFACGIERLILSAQIENITFPLPKSASVFAIGLGNDCFKEILLIIDMLRKHNIKVHIEFEQRSLKAQMRQANKIGCEFVIILGDNEFKHQNIVVKNMREGTQDLVSLNSLLNYLRDKIASLP